MDQKRIREFRMTEKGVYDRFRREQSLARREGLHPDNALVHKVGGLAVVARHSCPLVDKLESMTTTIASQVRSCLYNGGNEHSNICVFDEQRFVFRSPEHDQPLKNCVAIVEEVLKSVPASHLQQCAVRYGTPLYNQKSVIIPGMPSKAYVDLLLTIADRCAPIIPHMRASWGTHITAARFLESMSPEAAAPFFEFMRAAPEFGENPLRAIEVVYFECDGTSFALTPVARFDVNQCR